MPASTSYDNTLHETELSSFSSSPAKVSGNIPGIAQFDRNLPRPNAIQINVEGAFIVDQDTVDGRSTPPGTRDIALPFHTDEVSHIAVDVSIISLYTIPPP
jgi:type II pantothenate kinase